jgi:selenide,water dikinase
LADAQTSGGLLAAVPEAIAPDVVRALAEFGTLAQAVVGRVVGPGAGRIRVVA